MNVLRKFIDDLPYRASDNQRKLTTFATFLDMSVTFKTLVKERNNLVPFATSCVKSKQDKWHHGSLLYHFVIFHVLGSTSDSL
jgi:hypothetical protein